MSIVGQNEIYFNLDLSGRTGLPNTVREALLQSGRGKTALVLDVLYWLGFQEGHTFSVEIVLKVAKSAGINISEAVVRAGLRDEVFERQRLLLRRRGRPVIMYKLPGIWRLVQLLASGISKAVDRLQKADLCNLRAYRAALHRELIKRRPGQYARAWLAERLGVSKRATYHYEDGITVMAQYEDERVFEVEQLPARRSRSTWLMAVKRSWNEERRLHDVEVKHAPIMRVAAQRLIDAGWQVFKRTQLVNYYEVRT